MNGQPANGTDPLLTALGAYGGPAAGSGNDPMLVHMLKPLSPAIDGVPLSDAPSWDERGVHRPQGIGYDIGAVERLGAGESILAPRLYLPLVRR